VDFFTQWGEFFTSKMGIPSGPAGDRLVLETYLLLYILFVAALIFSSIIIHNRWCINVCCMALHLFLVR